MTTEEERAKRAAYMREWFQRQPPEKKAQYAEKNRQWKERNREKLRAQARERYLADPTSQRNSELRCSNSSPEAAIVRHLKSRARRKGLDFNLTAEDIHIPEVCPYLGIPISFVRGRGHDWASVSVDRIDSNKGYVKENIQVVSKKANAMKLNATEEELITFAKNVLTLHSERP